MPTPVPDQYPEHIAADDVLRIGSPEQPLLREFPGFRLGPLVLEIPARGVTAVLGDNGAGKSTLFTEVKRYVAAQGKRCANLPQDFTLPPFARVHSVCEFVAEHRVADRSRRAAAVEQALDVTDLTDVRGRRVRELSGGMKRRLGVALTVLGEPDLSIFDEPTAGLDMTQRTELRELLSAVGRRGPVLMSSHMIEDVSRTADYIVMLDVGATLFEGPSPDFLAHAHPGATDAWESAYRALIQRSNRAGKDVR